MHRFPPLIMAAPNGARRSKADHPNLPLTLDEIVQEAQACARAGAHMLHLHIRDEDGGHSLDPGRYRETLAALAAALPGFPVQITTEAAGLYQVAEQRALLERLHPTAASVSIREIARAPELAPALYGHCAEAGTALQHILYDVSDFAQLQRWQAAGVIPPGPADVITVLGRYSPPRAARPADLSSWVLPLREHNGRWMVCAFGPYEHAVLRAAAQAGADLRVGFENNLHLADGTLAQSTAQSVAHLALALRADASLSSAKVTAS